MGNCLVHGCIPYKLYVFKNVIKKKEDKTSKHPLKWVWSILTGCDKQLVDITAFVGQGSGYGQLLLGVTNT